ncbi:hypothetical protein MNBD_GAMMA06-108, partial [hydrothermal vent metagenome]
MVTHHAASSTPRSTERYQIQRHQVQRHQAPLKTSLFSTSFLCSWVLLYSPCVLPDVVATPGSATV